MKNITKIPVGTFLKYHTVGTVLKYHTVGTFLKYHTVGTLLKYHTVGTFLKIPQSKVLKSNRKNHRNRSKINTPSAQIHGHSLSPLDTEASINKRRS